MSISSAIGGAIGTLVGPVTDFLDRRRTRKHEEFRMEMELKKAKAMAAADRVAKGQQADIDWEIESIRNAGWRPEYLTILTTVVLVLVFVPQTQPVVIAGFDSLERTPMWFQIVVLMVYASAFGIRIFDNFKKVISHGR